MPKMKTHKGAKKRFRANANGKVKRACQGKRHILNKKSRERKRKLRAGGYVNEAQEKAMRTLIQAGGRKKSTRIDIEVGTVDTANAGGNK